MKHRMKKLLLCLTVVGTLVMLFSFSAFADSAKSNITFSANTTKVQKGNKIKIEVKNNAMTVESFTGGFRFDTDAFTVASVTKNNDSLSVVSSVDEANEAGTVGFAIIGVSDTKYKAGTLVTVELTAQKTGTAEFTLYEDSSGQDGFKGSSVATIKTTITDAEKHVLVKTDGKAATCTKDGYKTYWTCSDCGKMFSDANAEHEITKVQAVKAAGHKAGSPVKENVKEPTCTSRGSFDEVVYCTVCKEELSRETKDSAMLPHSWKAAWEWTGSQKSGYTGASVKVTCKNCGKEETAKAAITTATKGNTTVYTATAVVRGESFKDTKTVAKENLINPGWNLIGGVWYYGNSSGQTQKGWVKDGGKWYFLDRTTGAMKTGWVLDNNKWYYMSSSGAMLTGWIKSGWNWYYLTASGAAATGWAYVNGNWYYLDGSSCAMRTGWVKDGKTWYYMNSSGAMLTGWQLINGKWYFLKSSGAMAEYEWLGGYWFNADGSWTYIPRGSWRQNAVGWWFGDTSGWYAHNETVKINGVSYQFDKNGYWMQ